MIFYILYQFAELDLLNISQLQRVVIKVFFFQNNCFIHSLNDKVAQIVSTHLVHLADEYCQPSPSALIPFCEFGGHSGLLGYKGKDLQIPLCTAFNKRILNG